MKNKEYNILINKTLKYKTSVIIGVALIFLQPFIVVEIPMKVKLIFDEIIPESDINKLMSIFALITVLFILGKLIEYVIRILFYKINCNVVRDIRAELFKKIINANFNDLKNFEIGDLVTRIEDDIKSIRVFFVDTMAKMLSDIITLIITVYMMINLSPILTIIMLPLIISYIIISKKYRKKVEIHSEVYVNKVSESKSALIEFIKNLDIIKINNHNLFILNNYSKTLDEKRDSNIKLGKSRIKGTIMIEGLLNYIPYVIIFLGGLMVFKKYFTVGSIIAFIEYSKRAIKNLENINEYNFDMSNAKISLKRINEVYNLEKAPNETKEIIGNIIVKNVGIVKENNLIFDNLNIEIKKNMKLAIWGKSGSGKTTFSRVLMGIDNDYSGIIEYGEESGNTAQFRGGFIKSEPYITGGTLKENILMGRTYEQKKYDKVINITRLNNMKEEKIVNNCSHGEKQKICLARALYANSNILVVDEGLSNIDTIDLDHIINELIKIEKLTILMITHNLYIVNKYNKVIHFSNRNATLKTIDDFKKEINSKKDEYNYDTQQEDLYVN